MKKTLLLATAIFSFAAQAQDINVNNEFSTREPALYSQAYATGVIGQITFQDLSEATPEFILTADQINCDFRHVDYGPRPALLFSDEIFAGLSESVAFGAAHHIDLFPDLRSTCRIVSQGDALQLNLTNCTKRGGGGGQQCYYNITLLLK